MQTATHSDALSRFGCALSDPTRAEILLMLRDGPGYPSDLADKIGVSRQILSNHLACLRGCGLVVAQPEGRRSAIRARRSADRACARRPGRPRARRRPGLLPGRRDRRLLLMSAPLGTRRATLQRRIRLLVGATITYNVIEAVVALAEGTRVSSSALIGFGLDSVVEISSAAAVAWQFSANDPETREKAALRFIAMSFFALAAYVAVDAVRSLLGFGEARPSLIGIVLAAASLVIMPVLSLAQRSAGRELGSRSAVADSKQTLLCTYLSAILLAGLVLNGLWGWSWADPIAALGIAAIAVREGLNAWRGDPCC